MKKIKKVLALIVVIIAMSSVAQANYLYGLMTEFRTEDLIKLNAWEHIGKKGMGYNYGMIEIDTACMEIGHIEGILDTDDSEIKQVGFFIETTTPFNVPLDTIDFYVFYMVNNFWEPSARSIGMNYHPFPIDMDYKE